VASSRRVYERRFLAIIQAFKHPHRHLLLHKLAVCCSPTQTMWHRYHSTRSADGHGVSIKRQSSFVTWVSRYSTRFNAPDQHRPRRRSPLPNGGETFTARSALKCRAGLGLFENNIQKFAMVLVDDVATTGATLETCAQILLSGEGLVRCTCSRPQPRLQPLGDVLSNIVRRTLAVHS